MYVNTTTPCRLCIYVYVLTFMWEKENKVILFSHDVLIKHSWYQRALKCKYWCSPAESGTVCVCITNQKAASSFHPAAQRDWTRHFPPLMFFFPPDIASLSGEAVRQSRRCPAWRYRHRAACLFSKIICFRRRGRKK